MEQLRHVRGISIIQGSFLFKEVLNVVRTVKNQRKRYILGIPVRNIFLLISKSTVLPLGMEC